MNASSVKFFVLMLLLMGFLPVTGCSSGPETPAEEEASAESASPAPQMPNLPPPPPEATNEWQLGWVPPRPDVRGADQLRLNWTPPVPAGTDLVPVTRDERSLILRVRENRTQLAEAQSLLTQALLMLNGWETKPDSDPDKANSIRYYKAQVAQLSQRVDELRHSLGEEWVLRPAPMDVPNK